MTFHADVYGNLLALDYHLYTYDCEPVPSTFSKTNIESRGRISLGRSGEKPKDVRSKEAPKEPEKGPDGKPLPPPEEPKTFWQRYWLYIVMGGVYLLLGGGGAPQEGGAPGGQAAGGAKGKR